MFEVKYQIIHQNYDNFESISEIDIRYGFLAGSIILSTSDAKIEMEWEWIPLLDFAYCMKKIVSNLKTNGTSKEYFEFTENAETLEFLRCEKQLTISASFSPVIIITDWEIFEKAVNDFHFNIGAYIRNNTSDELPKVLQKYLSDETTRDEAVS